LGLWTQRNRGAATESSRSLEAVANELKRNRAELTSIGGLIERERKASSPYRPAAEAAERAEKETEEHRPTLADIWNKARAKADGLERLRRLQTELPEARSRLAAQKTVLAKLDREAHVLRPKVESLQCALFDRSLGTAFMWPDCDRDQYGNPVVVRDGMREDPVMALPYEVWLKEPRMEFVLVPAGEFEMGSDEGDADEKPVHRVKLTKGFYVAKYEITQGQWESVTGERPWSGKSYVRSDPRNPAVYISWDDCEGFVKKLGAGFRLPTEAEWEYACRAGSTTAYCLGDDGGKLKEYAWYQDNAEDAGEDYAHDVGKKLPNAWGLYDMHGNVWEWSRDWYGGYSAGLQIDPTGAERGFHRVCRSGGFSFDARDCRSAYRLRFSPDCRYRYLGARPLRSLP